MELAEDFNQILKSNLTTKLSQKELKSALETCKNVLKNEINTTKRVESLFKEEIWELFSSTVEGLELTKELERVTLELMQLFTIITPKGKLKKNNA